MEYSANLPKIHGKPKPGFTSGYRIVAPKWSDTALSGVGAKKFGGRWNSPGRSLVYLGGSRALSALELLVHLTTPMSRAKIYHLVQVEIPNDLISPYPSQVLPLTWRDVPAGRKTQEIGDDWLAAQGKLVLQVPSVLIPQEYNLLLNPEHEDFDKIISSEPVRFSFDKRL